MPQRGSRILPRKSSAKTLTTSWNQGQGEEEGNSRRGNHVRIGIEQIYRAHSSITCIAILHSEISRKYSALCRSASNAWAYPASDSPISEYSGVSHHPRTILTRSKQPVPWPGTLVPVRIHITGDAHPVAYSSILERNDKTLISHSVGPAFLLPLQITKWTWLLALVHTWWRANMAAVVEANRVPS